MQSFYRCAVIIAILQHCHYYDKVCFSTSKQLNSLSFIFISISIARQYTNTAHVFVCQIIQIGIVFGLGLCMNDNENFRSFKSKENIHKKEVGPYRGFGY